MKSPLLSNRTTQVWCCPTYVALFLLVPFLFNFAFASTPQLINYQAIVSGPSGPLDSTVTVIFTIWDAPNMGTNLWSETHNSLVISEGKLSVLLGSTTPITDQLFSDTGRYLGIKIGGDNELSPRNRLLSVPYALRLETIDGATGGDVSGALRISPDPAKVIGDALIVANNNGNTVLSVKVSSQGVAVVSLFDPVDSKDGFGAVPIEKVQINEDAIIIFDSTGTDTAITLTSTGDITAIGQIIVGPNSSGSSTATVFGQSNTAIGAWATVGGGQNNYTSGSHSTISGGISNFATGLTSSIGGGSGNKAGGIYATVAGGQNNSAAGNFSVVCGGGGTGPDSNSATLEWSAVVGGLRNRASGSGSFIGAGFSNSASGGSAVVGGGASDTAKGAYSGVFSGSRNLAGDASADTGAFVGGGSINSATGAFSTVAGGRLNSASGPFSTIGGGQNLYARAPHSSVASGYGNQAGDDILDSSAFVGGGFNNFAYAPFSTVAGGRYNGANGSYSSIVGGYDNGTSANYAYVGGGRGNRAFGDFSSVPGGYRNFATGRNSFAAGYNAQALHDGAIVLSADATIATSDSITSSAVQQMVLRATGFFYLTDVGGTASIPMGRFLNTSTGAYLTTGGTWTNLSDKNYKENFSSIDEQELLDKLSQLDIQQWNYKAEGDDIKHLGPVSQDFYEKFRLGHDDKGISTVDASGVALVAIQALHKQNLELKKELDELRQLVKELSKK